MFKQVKSFWGIVAVLLILAGCQDETLVNNGSLQGPEFTLTASKGVMSRTHLASDGKQTLWSLGDEIYVSNADGSVYGYLTLVTDDANKKVGTFKGNLLGEGDLDPNSLVYAVYPAPNRNSDGTLAPLKLGSVNGGDKLNAPMVGQIENKNVAFKNTCGILRLNLQNANNAAKSFKISAKSGEEAVKFLTAATVNVDADGVAILVYSAAENADGTITLSNAVGGFMYIPYFVDKDATVYVDGIEVATVEAAKVKGVLKQNNVKTLTYSETAGSLIEPAKVAISNTNVSGNTLSLNVSSATVEPGEGATEVAVHEFVNIPSITEALTDGSEDAVVPVSEVVVELPKIEVTSTATASVVSFEEIPQNVTVTIKEDEAATENKSIESLTVILPSTTTVDEAKEAIEINMPNTTVTVKTTDGNTLYIKNVVAETYDETLVVDQSVEITSLTILKGSVQVFGKIGELKRDDANTDEVTKVTIEVGGSVGQIVGEGFSVKDKNQPEIIKGDFVAEADGSYTIYTAKGWKTFAEMIDAGNTFEGKIIRLGADIDLNNELQVPIGVQEEYDGTKICFAGTLDGQNHAIKNLRIENSVGYFTGLFAYIQKATFMNLRLVGGEVKGNIYVGAFIGYGRGITLINCHNEGCKVSHTDENASYAGGLTGALHRTQDGSKNSFIIACSNSAEVSGTYCPAGITGGAWNGYVTLVACVNTGKISYSGTQTGQLNINASGIASSLGNNTWMYGCFSDCEIVEGGYNHSGLCSDVGYGDGEFCHSYSANTNFPPLTYSWGGSPEGKLVGHSSYNDAVDKLNIGIDMYNWGAALPCNYKFVKGEKPTLIYAEPSKVPGGGSNNFGNGGKF